MLANNTITYYKKELDEHKIEKYKKHIFEKVWLFAKNDSRLEKGYENNNTVSVRIPMEEVQDASIFKIGDIIAVGRQGNIQKQTDLKDVEFYNVTSIHFNFFGNNPHIFLGGK